MQVFSNITRYINQMAEAVNLVPNVGVNEQAVAGNQGAIFTAADREIIKKRVAEVEGKLSFAERIRNLFSKSAISFPYIW